MSLQPLVDSAVMRGTLPRVPVSECLHFLVVAIKLIRIKDGISFLGVVDPVLFNPKADVVVNDRRDQTQPFRELNIEGMGVIALVLRASGGIKECPAIGRRLAKDNGRRLSRGVNQPMQTAPALIAPQIGILFTDVIQGKANPAVRRIIAPPSDVLKNDGGGNAVNLGNLRIK